MENEIANMNNNDLLRELYRLMDDKNWRIDPLLHARFTALELEAEKRGLHWVDYLSLIDPAGIK